MKMSLKISAKASDYEIEVSFGEKRIFYAKGVLEENLAPEDFLALLVYAKNLGEQIRALFPRPVLDPVKAMNFKFDEWMKKKLDDPTFMEELKKQFKEEIIAKA